MSPRVALFVVGEPLLASRSKPNGYLNLGQAKVGQPTTVSAHVGIELMKEPKL
jgi:hypothetical protein